MRSKHYAKLLPSHFAAWPLRIWSGRDAVRFRCGGSHGCGLGLRRPNQLVACPARVVPSGAVSAAAVPHRHAPYCYTQRSPPAQIIQPVPKIIVMFDKDTKW